MGKKWRPLWRRKRKSQKETQVNHRNARVASDCRLAYAVSRADVQLLRLLPLRQQTQKAAPKKDSMASKKIRGEAPSSVVDGGTTTCGCVLRCAAPPRSLHPYLHNLRHGW